MSRLSRSRACGAVGLLLAAAILGATLLGAGDLGRLDVLAALVLVQATTSWISGHLQPADEQAIWQFDEAVFIVALVLVPAPSTLAALLIGNALGQLADRLPPRAVGANAGMLAPALWAALAVFGLLRPAGAPFDGRAIAAAVVASVVLAVVNEAFLAGFVRIVGDGGFLQAVLDGLGTRLRRAPLLLSAGILAALAAEARPWAAMFAVPLMYAAVFVLGEHTRAERDRQRTLGLFEAASAVHATVDADLVNDALLDAVRRLLRCRVALLSESPPEPHAWGTRLAATAGERWLVVSDPVNGAPLDPEALNLLAALAAVGSSALENARLVEAIKHQAVHDPVTGLANQVLFEDRVAQAITSSRRSRERFAVMVLDIDAFKKVNDSLGHSMGNELLRLIGDRLASSVRDIDTVARLGSDHYTLLFPGIGGSDEVAVLAERLLAVVRRPVALGGHELFMTASAGLAIFPEDGTRAEHLLRNADGAMHRAKETGRDSFQVYASGMNEAAHMRLVRESELHLAVQRDELRVMYQPQIDLRSGQIVGVEALVRWEHPVLGLIPPHEFVPLAEESGLIVAVDTWVLHRACAQARAWIDAGLRPIRMAVNLSGRHFQASNKLLDTVKSALLESGLDASLLELEVTEGIAVGEEEGTARALQEVRSLGVKLAIDDFGTGYSMLGRLQTFPIDRLKIDRSFVSEIQSAHSDAPIVAAMIAMSRSLNIEVVAEGIETLEQQTFLRFHGCDQGQGFLFSEAVPADKIARLLDTPSLGFNVSAAC